MADPHDTLPLTKSADDSSTNLPNEPPAAHTAPETHGDSEKPNSPELEGERKGGGQERAVSKAKLWVVVVALTLTTFLVSMNASTLATVRYICIA
jgi:hypothetical protein